MHRLFKLEAVLKMIGAIQNVLLLLQISNFGSFCDQTDTLLSTLDEYEHHKLNTTTFIIE